MSDATSKRESLTYEPRHLGDRTAPPYHRALHLLALLTTCATFPLICMGGLVTSHGAGMSVPDWPNSYGYNMFTFPPNRWVGGIFYEHTHRLMGTVVGLCSIVLTIVAWRIEQRRWVRWLTVAVLGAVIFQGVLGGLRVVLVNLDLAVVHACFAQAFFCLSASTAVVTSRWWLNAKAGSPAANGVATRSLARLAGVTAIAIYLQLVVGALMRHYGAGLAIPDVPLAYGRWLPPVSEAGLKLVNDLRVYDLQLPRVSLFQVWIHFTHRLGAIVVATLVLATVVAAFRTRGPGSSKKLLTPAALMAGLLLVQVTLGVLTVVLRKPADVASAHVAGGALLLVTTFVLTLRAARIVASLPRATRADATSEPGPAAAPRPATA